MSPVFETSRLIIRKLTEQDFEGFHEMQSNPTVMQFVYGEAQNESQNRAGLEKCIQAYSQTENRYWVWAIVDKESQRFVGTCAVVPSEDGDNEIGYRFLESAWGNGFGKEVCFGLIDYLINEQKLTSLVANCDSKNIASAKILQGSRLVQDPCGSSDECPCDLVFRWSK